MKTKLKFLSAVVFSKCTYSILSKKPVRNYLFQKTLGEKIFKIIKRPHKLFS